MVPSSLSHSPKRPKRLTIFIGLCGEFMREDLLLNPALHEDFKKKWEGWESESQKKVWRVKATGCCIVATSLRLIDLHQATHGGCDTLVLKGTLRHLRNGRLHLEAKEMDSETYEKILKKENLKESELKSKK